MTPDINIKDHYYKFIGDAERDEQYYSDNIIKFRIARDEVFSFIQDIKDWYKDIYTINLDRYITDENVDYENLKVKTIRYVHMEDNESDKSKLLQVIKYCNICKRIDDYERLIILAKKRKDIKLGEYRTIVVRYYDEVHRTVLNGMGYKFSKGIGTFCINRWKMDPTSARKNKRLDFRATAINKAKLVEQGYTLFNKAEAEWHEKRGLPYDGVDYRVYRNELHFYEISIIKSNILSKNAIMFKHTDYVNVKHKGKTFAEMADDCKDMNDIINYQVDIRFKLNMFLHKYPNKYLLYIRNEEQNRHKPGAHK